MSLLILLVVGYALVTGLAYSAGVQIMKHLTTVEVKDPEKKPPPPPPPPKNAPPPPIVAPPPPINVAVAPPQIQTVMTPPPPAPVLVTTPVPAPAPPPAPSRARGASPKGQSDWAERIQDNYPSDALRAEKEGRVGVSVTIGPDGRVSNCEVSSPSGTPSLDSAACQGMMRYARFNPALDDAGSPTSGSFRTAIVYKITGDQ